MSGSIALWERAQREKKPLSHVPAYPIRKPRRKGPKPDGLPLHYKAHILLRVPEAQLHHKYEKNAQEAFHKKMFKLLSAAQASPHHRVFFKCYEKPVWQTHSEWHPRDPRKDKNVVGGWRFHHVLDNIYPQTIIKKLLYKQTWGIIEITRLTTSATHAKSDNVN